MFMILSFAWVAIVLYIVPEVDTPRAEAMAYLEAIADGDAELAALLSVGDFPPEDSDSSLLTNEVLENAVERISDYRIDDISRAYFLDGRCGDTWAKVSYTLGGERHSGRLLFVKERTGWVVCDGLLSSLDIVFACYTLGKPTRVAPTTVSGVAIPEQRVSTLALYPGIYRVEAPPVDAAHFEENFDNKPFVDVAIGRGPETVRFCLHENE